MPEDENAPPPPEDKQPPPNNDWAKTEEIRKDARPEGYETK